MPPIRTSKSTCNRVILYTKFEFFGTIMTSPCTRCELHQLECRVVEGTNRCGCCVKAGTKCDVYGPSVADWEALEREEQRLETERRETLSKLRRLDTQQRSLRNRAGAMLRRGLKTLDELDAVEENERLENERMEKEKSDAAAVVASTDSPFFDVLDPSLSMLSDVDLEALLADMGTSGEMPVVSQGS